MLGTNDFKARLNLSAYAIAEGAAQLLDVATSYVQKIRQILLVAPAIIVATEDQENTLAFKGALEKSEELATHYKYYAQKYSCSFLDASSIIQSSSVDGIHLDAVALRCVE